MHAPNRLPKTGVFKLLSTVGPMLLVFILFIGLGFFWFLPALENLMLQARKAHVKELVRTAWSAGFDLYQQSVRGEITEEEAQQRFIRRIRDLRYGEDMKDYFWIHTMDAVVIAHPYHEVMDLSSYVDQAGTRVVYEMNQIINEYGEGYQEYYWQWKDDPNRVEKKISYVLHFEPWDWVVATGFYLVDVRQEIRIITRSFVSWMTLAFILATGLVVLSILRGIRHTRELRDKEALAERNEERLHNMAQHVAHGIAVLEDNKIVFCNSKMYEMLGLDAAVSPDNGEDQVLQEKLRELTARHTSGAADTSVSSVIGGWVATGPVGGPKKYLMSHYSLHASKNESYLVIRDATEKRRLEKELIEAKERAEESDKLKSAFLNNISHEFRTPLNAISGMVEILTANLPEEMDCEMEKKLIVDNVMILTRLLHVTLEVAQFESTYSQSRLVEVFLDQFVEDSISHTLKQWEKHLRDGVTIVPFFDETLSEKHVKTDPDKLRLVLSELLSNAIKYTYSGQIRVGYLNRKGEVLLFVEDSGIGISKEDVPKLFSLFHHGKSPYISLHEGVGLGLNLVKKIVDLMGGKVWFDSKPGRGTVFYVSGLVQPGSKHSQVDKA